MTLLAGARLGPYEILSAIGAGGMGEVYRATDTNLKRQVAIKVLPESLSCDPERLARFQREAEVLASLNHPHIAQIYGLEKSDGTTALVMELVEGEDLSQRIARGPIPLDEALPIAKQIAEALEAAHEQGIIHRDLKPANIKVREDGTVKVLDFGLAKLTEAPAGAPSTSALSMSPTITSPAMMTGVGVILGTAAYMSPEQAKGRPADKRADIWAFGCVLYEMLTGKRPFEGEDVSDTLANILKVEPDWTALRADVPGPIRLLLRGCLDKDRPRRIADIAVAQFVLAQHAGMAVDSTGPAQLIEPERRSFIRRIAVPSAAILTSAIAASAVIFLTTRPMTPRLTRLSIRTFGDAELSIDANDRMLALPPDGSRIAYIGGGNARLFVRVMDQLDPVLRHGPGQPREPFFSPDGDWIGVFSPANSLKKLAASGGPPITVVETMDGTSRGATWGADGRIVFATNSPATGLQMVPANGGAPTILTRPDPQKGERDHFWPEFLPGGHALLFTIAPVGSIDNATIAVLDLRDGTQKIVVRGGSDAHYLSDGYLVYGVAGTIRAVAFDLSKLETIGSPVPVLSQVVTTSTEGAANFAVSRDGTLAYVPGGATAAASRSMVWVDRQGHEESIAAPIRGYTLPRISPDGTRIALDIRDQQSDIWIWDIRRQTLTRSTFDPAWDRNPVWTPDGAHLIFTSDRIRTGSTNLYWQPANGTGPVARLGLGDSTNGQTPSSVSTDGKRLFFSQDGGLSSITLDNDHRVQSYMNAPAIERNAEISPDGRWLGYDSNESGVWEIYVRPFPNIDAGRWQISTAGGSQPTWNRNGQELFYLGPSGAMMSVSVERGSTFVAGTPVKLFDGQYYAQTGSRPFDVTPDGKRFLMIKAGIAPDAETAPPEIVIVQNWTEELKRLVPTK